MNIYDYQPEEIVRKTEAIHKEMHTIVDGMMQKNKRLSYQDCVTVFLLWKIASLEAKFQEIAQ